MLIIIHHIKHLILQFVSFVGSPTVNTCFVEIFKSDSKQNVI